MEKEITKRVNTLNKTRKVELKHPDHSQHKKRISRIRGQVDGVERMIDERRYCIDIVTQIRATRAALKSLEDQILETHLRGCVRSAFQSKDTLNMEEKIDEIMEIIR